MKNRIQAEKASNQESVRDFFPSSGRKQAITKKADSHDSKRNQPGPSTRIDWLSSESEEETPLADSAEDQNNDENRPKYNLR